ARSWHRGFSVILEVQGEIRTSNEDSLGPRRLGSTRRFEAKLRYTPVVQVATVFVERLRRAHGAGFAEGRVDCACEPFPMGPLPIDPPATQTALKPVVLQPRSGWDRELDERFGYLAQFGIAAQAARERRDSERAEALEH